MIGGSWLGKWVMVGASGTVVEARSHCVAGPSRPTCFAISVSMFWLGSRASAAWPPLPSSSRGFTKSFGQTVSTSHSSFPVSMFWPTSSCWFWWGGSSFLSFSFSFPVSKGPGNNSENFCKLQFVFGLVPCLCGCVHVLAPRHFPRAFIAFGVLVLRGCLHFMQTVTLPICVNAWPVHAIAALAAVSGFGFS